jgi:hypothetical protein
LFHSTITNAIIVLPPCTAAVSFPCPEIPRQATIDGKYAIRELNEIFNGR